MKRKASNPASQLSYPIQPRRIDQAAVALFSSHRYDRINHVVSEGVCQTYRHELSRACKALLENERVVGRVGTQRSRKGASAKAETWLRDPVAMSDDELFRARVDLEQRIQQQKELNEQSRGEVEILCLASETVELEVGCMFTQLEIEENKDF
jgi:hypothetical protein